MAQTYGIAFHTDPETFITAQGRTEDPRDSNWVWNEHKLVEGTGNCYRFERHLAGFEGVRLWEKTREPKEQPTLIIAYDPF